VAAAQIKSQIMHVSIVASGKAGEMRRAGEKRQEQKPKPG